MYVYHIVRDKRPEAIAHYMGNYEFFMFQLICLTLTLNDPEAQMEK